MLLSSPARTPLVGTQLRLLKTQQGRCPLCDAFLLLADQEPQSPDEWEQWLLVTRKAVRKDPITAEQGHGTPEESVAFRLVHADCRRRSRTADVTEAWGSACP